MVTTLLMAVLVDSDLLVCNTTELVELVDSMVINLLEVMTGLHWIPGFVKKPTLLQYGGKLSTPNNGLLSKTQSFNIDLSKILTSVKLLFAISINPGFCNFIGP
eukprot:NODE_1188_length_1864_cov_0.584703.p3 type:complete len:104 gc:universal NODE_1188_length_1864_cov_0.584703:1015-1326(+)